jgi:hypothetical protein
VVSPSAGTATSVRKPVLSFLFLLLNF